MDELQRAWSVTAVAIARERAKSWADRGRFDIVQSLVSFRDIISASKNGNEIRHIAQHAKATGVLDVTSRWSSDAYEWLLGDFAADQIAIRFDNATAPATGPSRRQGRL